MHSNLKIIPLLSCVLTLSLSIWCAFCNCHLSATDEIVYCENFNAKGDIFVHFVDSVIAILNIDKIKSLFIFPTQFYQGNVVNDGKSLPAFLVNATADDFCLFLLFCYNYQFKESSVCENIQVPSSIEKEELRICTEFRTSFQDANELNEFIRGFNSEFDETAFFPYSFEILFNRIRCLVPIAFFQNLNFITVTNHAELNDVSLERTKKFIGYDFKALKEDKALSKVGSGAYANCYKIATRLNESRENQDILIFKNLVTPFCSNIINWDLKEMTTFQLANIKDKSRFNIMSCLVLDKSSGYGIGFITKYAKYGDLKNFITNHLKEPNEYFFKQLIKLAESLKDMHTKYVFHNDIHFRNVLVDEKNSLPDSFEEKNPIENYKFLLCDFGKISKTHKIISDAQCSHEGSVCNCLQCQQSIASDWNQYNVLLEKTITYFHHEKMAIIQEEKNHLLVNIFLREISNYFQAEQYLNDIISGTIFSIDGTEVYKVKADAAFLTINFHGKIFNGFKKGDSLNLRSKDKYTLSYMQNGMDYFVLRYTTIDAVNEINQFAKKTCGIVCLLERE